MKKYIWCVILVIILVIALVTFVWLYISKSSDYSTLTADYNLLSTKYDFLSVKYDFLYKDYNLLTEKFAELSNMYSDLQTKYYKLVEDYKNLNLEYNKSLSLSADLSSKLSAAKEELTSYKYEIQTSLDWFKDNATLKNNLIKSKLSTKCYSETSNSCRIKGACLDLVNEQFIGLKYKDDTLLNKADKFQAIDEFLANKGGDCEDFSLLYKAEINYLLDSCKNKKPKIEVFVPGSGNYFIDNSNSWYYPKATKYTLKEGYIYPNIVCGVLKDPNKNNVFGGHCVVALSKEKITSISDLNKIDLAELIEPQTGQYIGRIKHGPKTFGVEYYEKGKYIPQPVSYIKQIITDDDYYLYMTEWKSYKYIYDKFIALEQDIDYILQKNAQ